MRKILVSLLALAVLMVGGVEIWLASRPELPGTPRLRATRSPPTPRSGTAQRPPTLRVENLALGQSRVRVAQATLALKRVGLWGRLTRHLYIVRLGSRPGVTDIPDDGHLADAYLRAQIDDQGAGGVCDIMFYPRAMKEDLARANDYYAQGLAGPPPELGDFWASILAHELAHCLPYETKKGLPRESPEPVAEKWEARALRRLER